ncbi:MAG: sensor histidine kinase [Dehalobacterium sp.]
MGLREKCLIHTNLNSDQIAVLEKMIEHFVFLQPYYREITLVINGHHRQVVLITSKDMVQTVSYDHPKVQSWFDDQERFSFTDKGKEKRVPLYFEKTNIAGVVVYKEKMPNQTENLEKLLDLCRRMPESFHPTDYLVPDGVVVFDASGSVQYQNFVAESIFHRLGFAGMTLNKLAQSLEISQKQFQSAFLGTLLPIKQFEVSMVFNPLFMEGKFVGVLLIVSDLTPIKKKEKELIEKSTVIKEIHHRVKNNLQTITSLLRLQMRRINSKLAEKVFTESINRILSIALIHEALSKQDLEVINIKQTSFNILQMILSNMVDPNKKIHGEVSGDDIYLTATTASSVSLCITELIQNAVEHAFVNLAEGNIRISVEQNKEDIMIKVKDNGIGVSMAKIENESSLGMKIVNTIIQQNLKGEFSVEGQRYGTIACIRFPKSNIEGVGI